jgi:hypothetical protein
MIPKFLVERFGKPSPCDGLKVSGEFIFTSTRGETFSIYDWKMTSLYGDGGISPDELWDSDEIVPLQLGG